MKHLYIYILIFLGSLNAYAQKAPGANNNVEVQDTTFINRLSFRTNALYWLMTVPNVAVEFDLINSQYNKLTLNIEGKYNWNTSHSLLPSSVFDLWEVRPEVRKYWRTEFRSGGSGKIPLKDKLFSKYRENPRYWRAYYAGIYASAAGYTFKFGEEGIKGISYGIGISGGFGIPLYSYKQNFIDLELGGSIGFEVAKYDKFRHDFNNNAYVNIPEKSKGLHFVPYPLITDLHVSFVYRFGNSIKSKYKKIDYEKIQLKEVEKKNRRLMKDSIRQARILEDSLQDIRKQFVKDSIRNERLLKDSLDALKLDAAVQDEVKGKDEVTATDTTGQKAEKKKKSRKSEKSEVTEQKKDKDLEKVEKESKKKKKNKGKIEKESKKKESPVKEDKKDKNKKKKSKDKEEKDITSQKG